jgi:glycosyltransferase involved in cell wall biosynthesis
MKTLYVSNDPSIFNVASSARARMRNYARAVPDGELHIISRAPRGAREEQDGNLFLHPVTMPRLLIICFLPTRVRELIATYHIDIVSAQDPFEYGLIALRAIAGTKAKLYIQVHTDFLSPWFVKTGNLGSPSLRMPLLNRVRRHFADKVLPEADGIRVVSKRIKDSLTRRYGARIVEPSVIPVVVDRTVPPAVRLPPHHFNFVFIAIGRVEPEKRLEDIVDALARIHEQYPQAGLMIVGAGRERHKIARYAHKWRLENHVLFLGERADAWGLMQSAQAFIQASAYEGYGRTLIEAALARVPIITTDVGIVGEVFKGYRDVLAVPVADPAALAVAMVGMMEDVQARQLLIRSAQVVALEHLSAFTNQPALIAVDLARTLV